MRFKIDTKEVFHVITIEEKDLTANMAGELIRIVEALQSGKTKNLILNFEHVQQTDAAFREVLERLHETQYGQQKSFVVCAMTGDVKKVIDVETLMDRVQVVETESEAWDLVQMEEIERELGLDI